MLTRAIPAAAVAAVTAIGLLIGGCQPINYTVTIDYAKLGICGNFQENPATGPQQNEEAGEGAFVLYTIKSIANNASGAKNFPFDPTLLFVSAGGSLAQPPFANHFTAHAQTVLAGTTATSVGWLALDVSGDPKSLLTATDNLLYHTPSGESVVLNEVSNSATIIGAGTCNPTNVP